MQLDDEIVGRVKALVARTLHLSIDPADLDDDRKLDTLGLDSLNVVDILMGLEAEFGIGVEDADIDFDTLDSVASLAQFVTLQMKV